MYPLTWLQQRHEAFIWSQHTFKLVLQLRKQTNKQKAVTYNSSSAVPAQELGSLLSEPHRISLILLKNCQLHQFSTGLQRCFCFMCHSAFQTQEQVFREKEAQTSFCGNTDLITNRIATWRYIHAPAKHKLKKKLSEQCIAAVKCLLPGTMFISPTQKKKNQWHSNHSCDSSAELFTHTAIRQAG